MELSGRQIEETQFAVARRGYDRKEVDRFIAACATYASNLEERMRISEVKAAANEDELTSLRTNIDVLLHEATEARRKIIEEAKAEAGAIVSNAPSAHAESELADAASKAAAILAEAETTAKLKLESVDEIRGAAQEKADTIVRRAEESAAMTQAEADRILGKAKMDSKSMLEEARVTQASMDAQLAEIRRLLGAARLGAIEPDSSDARSVTEDSDSDLVIDLRDPVGDPETQEATG